MRSDFLLQPLFNSGRETRRVQGAFKHESGKARFWEGKNNTIKIHVMAVVQLQQHFLRVKAKYND